MLTMAMSTSPRAAASRISPLVRSQDRINLGVTLAIGFKDRDRH
jgi:hypothetical protein